MKKNYRAVIFDLDDTLYSEREYIRSGFQAVATWADSHLGIPREEGCRDLEELFNQGVRLNTFNLWLKQHKIDDEIVSRLVEIYREHTPIIHPYDGVPELLFQLKQETLLAILSDGHKTSQTNKIAALRLGPYFHTVVLSDEWGKEAWKPNPWIYSLTLERLGVRAEEALYVADNPSKDFWGARQINLPTVRLRVPSGLYAVNLPPDPSYAPDVEIFSHRELSEFLL